MPDRRVLPRMATSTIVVLTLATVPPLSAQEAQWRYDYTAACREAREKQRPVVMDFGTSNCFWCKKLDASTFRDPAVVRQLNEQFPSRLMPSVSRGWPRPGE